MRTAPTDPVVWIVGQGRCSKLSRERLLAQYVLEHLAGWIAWDLLADVGVPDPTAALEAWLARQASPVRA
jgi:hypothetical protein